MRAANGLAITRPVTGTCMAVRPSGVVTTSLIQRGLMGRGDLRPPSLSSPSKKITSRSISGVLPPNAMPYRTSTG